MVSLETPICEFDKAAVDFLLPGVDGKDWSLADCAGEKGLLVMFICNHCPYVKAIRERLVRDTRTLKDKGINTVAIMSNDPTEYAEDSFENMQIVSNEFDFPFPYLFDESQQVAKAFGAVCTPDFLVITLSLNYNIVAALMPAVRKPLQMMYVVIYMNQWLQSLKQERAL